MKSFTIKEKAMNNKVYQCNIIIEHERSWEWLQRNENPNGKISYEAGWAFLIDDYREVFDDNFSKTILVSLSGESPNKTKISNYVEGRKRIVTYHTQHLRVCGYEDKVNSIVCFQEGNLEMVGTFEFKFCNESSDWKKINLYVYIPEYYDKNV